MEQRTDSGEAALMLHLARWHSAAGIPAALTWLWSDDFPPEYDAFLAIYPPGSEGDRVATQICAYFDVLGALCRHGVVPEEPLLDWLAAGPVWDRVKGYVHGTRRRTSLTSLWSNFEALATSYKRQTCEYST